MSLKKPIKVLQLGSPSGLYGAERWILALIKYLDPQKVVSVVGVIKDDPSQDAKLCQEAKALGFQTIEFEVHGRVNFSIIQQLKKYLVDENIDILHTHFYKTDIIGYLATRGTNCRIVSTPHGWTQRPDFKLGLYEFVDRLFFPFLDAVCPLSQEMFNTLAKIPGVRRHLYLIWNGVDLSEITRTTVVHESVIEAKKEGNFIIGYIGRLIEGKGLDILFAALSRLEIDRWRLFIIGEGPQQKELQGLAVELGLKENIKFLGFRVDRLDFLRGFDVFILPSRSEGLPRSLMEAMGAGTAVIATDIPGCNDLIKHRETGLLFKTDDHVDLSNQIEKLLDSEKLRSSLSKAAFFFVTENYSAAHMARKYQKCFFQLIS